MGGGFSPAAIAVNLEPAGVDQAQAARTQAASATVLDVIGAVAGGLFGGRDRS